MNTGAKTVLFVLLPMLLVMVGAGAWYQVYGRRDAELKAQRQIDAAAQLTARLVQRHINQVDYALESIMVLQHLDEYFMYQQVGLLDEAEDARLSVELAMERLASANPEMQRIECYTPAGERFVAVVDGRRELGLANAAGATWLTNTLANGEYQNFESNGRLRLTRARSTEYSDDPISVITIVFDFTDDAAQSAQFATRHLSEVEVAITDAAGVQRFQLGELPDDAATLDAVAAIQPVAAHVSVRQTSDAALGNFYAAQWVLLAALALVTFGLLVIAALGTRAVTKDLRTAHHALELKSSQLAKANADLERSNKDLSDFAKVASHDLQAPLRGIMGFAELLGEEYADKFDEQGRNWLGQVIAGTQRMQTLIDDLLAYARVDAQTKPPRPTDFRQVFDDAVGLLQAPIREAQAEVTCGPLPTLPADRAQMVQVLQNLIGNAVKYHGERAPEVSVSGERNGSGWVFAVADNGIGIEPQYYERVFEIFKRLHTEEDYEGTGIGLAVCRRVVQRHGGQMWIESRPGEGSTFYFTLPDRREDPT